MKRLAPLIPAILTLVGCCVCNQPIAALKTVGAVPPATTPPQVDAAGHVVPFGPHIITQPTYSAIVGGKWVQVPVLTSKALFASLALPTTVSPPIPSDYGATTDASASPLFAGADTDDVNQNQADSCYLLSVWDSLLRQNKVYSQAILVRSNSINSLTFRRNINAPVTVQTDSRISQWNLAHPSPTTGAIDACILEKDYCYFRTGANTVASINFGFPGSVMTDLGISNITVTPTATASIIATLSSGNVCVASSNATIPAGINIVPSHAYSVVVATPTAITLRNPWGHNALGIPVNPAPNSLMTINWADFGKAFTSVSCGTSYAPLPAPTPPPLPPLSFIGNFPATIPVGQILKVSWVSNADKIVITDVIWHSTTTVPANGSWMCGMPTGDVWTFTATRASDKATLIKTVTVTSP